AAFFTTGCVASRAPVSLARRLGPGRDGAAAAAVLPSTVQARRRGLKWKGTVHEKYVALLTTTERGQTFIGDKHAWGLLLFKVV
ncbi:unnamed protein product, partial [Closterium sp. Naga37s-1]